MGVVVDGGSPGPLPEVIEFGTATFDQSGSTEPRDVALSVPIATAQTAGGNPLSGDVAFSVVANNSGKASRSFAKFDGVDDQIDTGVTLTGATEFTIEMDVRWNESGGDYYLDGLNANASNSIRLGLRVTSGVFQFNAGQLPAVVTTWVPNVGQWYRVAVTVQASGSWFLYVDGVEHSNGTNNVFSSAITSTLNFFIGAASDAGVLKYFSSRDYSGYRLFDRALTASEVDFLYSSGESGSDPTASNLLFEYRFESGAGSVVADSSGNGNDAAAINTDATFWGFEAYDVATPTTLIDQVLQWGDDLSAVTTGFTGTLEGGSSIDFASDPDVDSYVVTLGGKTQTIHHPKPVILRESWDGGGVSYIHYGIGKVNLNIDNGDWPIADVRKFGVVRHQDYFRGWTETSDALFIESLVDFNYRHPGAITCAHFRLDLARFGEAGSLRPFWGANGFPSLTLAMSSKPRDTINWLDFVAANMPGWSQAPSNITPAIGNPYNLSLVPDGGGAGVHHWICRAAKMDISNSAWLNAAADAAKLVRQKVNEAAALIDPAITNALAATHVGPEKWQFAKPKTRTRVFKQWILDNANPGWVLNSNSGGLVEASWPDHAEMFDQPGETVLDVFEASWTMAALMGAKDPGGLVVYDPVNYHVGIAASNQQIFKDQCLDKYGMTGEQAREYFRDKQYEIAALDHVRYMVPVKTNTGAGDSEAELFQGFMTTAEVQVLRDIATFKPMIYPPHNQLVPTV